MWEISRNRLIAGLKILELVPEKVGLSSSEFFWFRGKGEQVTISVASYIMGEITLTGHGEWPKQDFYVDRRMLMPFVMASLAIKNKNTFQFSIHKKVLTIKHGSRQVTFVSQRDIKGYGNLKKILKEEENEVPISDDLQELLSCGQNCAVPDSVVPHLNCVFINKGKVAIEAYSASAKVFYMGIGQGAVKVKKAIPFPLYLIDLLKEKSLKTITWRGKYIVLKFEKGIIWQPVSEEALKSFPLKSIQKHAAKADTMPVTFTASSRRLSKLMVRLGFYLQHVRRKDWVVQMTGKKGTTSITVSTNIPGVKFKEELSTDKVKKDFSLDWPLDVLEPMFMYLSTKTKKLGVIVRTDEHHGVSYIRVGQYWLSVTSKKKA